MNGVTPEYLFTAQIWMLITTLVYFLMNGAQIFETAVIVPKWTASPPKSLEMFRGKNGLDFKVFWITFHLIHELTFILAIIFTWNLEEIRLWLLLLFILHITIRIWTLLYFAPRIIHFQKLANTGGNDPDLQQNVLQWKKLNYIRVAIFVAISLGHMPLLLSLFSM